MSKSFLKRESEKQCGDRRGNQDAGGGNKDAGKKRSFAGLRDVALIRPVLSPETALPYNGEFPAADALMREYGVNSLDKVLAQIQKSEYRGIALEVSIQSLARAGDFYDDGGYDPRYETPPSDQFVAVTTGHNVFFPVAKTKQDQFLTTMISRYSLLPVFSAVTVLDYDDEDRFFPDDDFTKADFLAGIPEIMRQPIDDPKRIFRIPLKPLCSRAYAMNADVVSYPRSPDLMIDEQTAPDLIAPLVETYKRYVELYRETQGFQLYDPDGVMPAICVMTKVPNEDGICPVRRLYDDECEMAGSCDNGALYGWRTISHTFSANRPGVFRERLNCFLQNAALTLQIAEEIGNEN